MSNSNLVIQKYEKLNFFSNQKSKSSKKRNRNPGKYPDKYCPKKEENNTFLLQSCKLLNSYYGEEGIIALILDGKEMRTTKTLKSLGHRLKHLTIVEFNKDTFEEMQKNINLHNDNFISVYNCHMSDYVQKYNDPKVNVVYFDLNLNFFSSNKTDGSDIIIHNFLQKSSVDEMIFAATFCLRTSESINYEQEQKFIIIILEKIFITNQFEWTNLIENKDMRYQGQTGANKALMFAIYYLKKIKSKNQNF